MSNVLRIKRRASGAAGAPSSLENAELAYNEVDDVLYYGKGTGGAGGSASVVLAIGGVGAYVGLTGNQTIGGTKTFSSPVNADITGVAAEADAWSTARDLSLSGDVTATLSGVDGSGNVSATATLANSGVTAGTYTKITVDAKGRATVGADASISDLDAPSADVDWGGYKLTNLATPTSDADAATKLYVDSVAQGLDVKASVRVATTANITLSGTQTIDGVALSAGDRVLVKDQSSASANGIYVVNVSTWARSSDMDAWTDVPGAFTFVEEGTANADTGWVCTSNAGGTLGTTAINFAQFSAAGSYVAGNGLTLTGNSFSVQADGSTITVGSSGIKLSDTYAGQSSIVTVGTIGTGTWQGSTIAVGYGGTGVTTLTGLVKGNGTSAFSAAIAGTDYLSPSSTIDGGTF